MGFFDGETELFDLPRTSPGDNYFADATNVIRSRANWESENVGVNCDINSGSLFIRLYKDVDAEGKIAYASFESLETPPVLDHATDGDVVGNTADVTGEALLTEPAHAIRRPALSAGLTSTVTGTAKRFLLHTTSGDVVDSTDATVTGEAELINAVYLHETEGVLTGQVGTIPARLGGSAPIRQSVICL